MLLFLFEAILSIAGIVIVSFIVGAILQWTMEGHWFKRYFIGYPTQFIFYNFCAVLAWILTFCVDILFSFVRFAYTLVTEGPGHSNTIFYMDSSESKDAVLIFWVIFGNLLAIYVIYNREKEVKEEAKWEAKKKEMEEAKVKFKPKTLSERMNDDSESFNKKFNIQ